jgi:hypothetical protein
MLGEELVDGDKIAQALRHLLALELEHPIMQPVARERLTGIAFGLGDFVFMVGEDEVVAAAVNVDLLAQVSQVHRGAFDVPPRPALAPRAVPARLTRLRRLPQGKVAFAFLLPARLHPRTRDGIFQLAPRELAVVGVGTYAEIDIAVRRRVRVIGLDQIGDHANDLGDGLRNPRKHGRPPHVEAIQLLFVILGIAVGQRRGVFTQLGGPRDDLIVHIGEVHDVANFVPAIFQIATDEVEYDRRHRMAHVRVGVHRGTADIHPHLARFKGFEGFLLATQGIENDQGHDELPRVNRRMDTRGGMAVTVNAPHTTPCRRSLVQHARSAIPRHPVGSGRC